MASQLIEAALERAHDDALRLPKTSDPRSPPGRPRRRIAMGDPQAPMGTVFSILEAHGLLAESGHLVPDVHLVSMGDHFDWGGPDRSTVARSGLELLAWLAAHPPEQVTLLVGNHDLGRVGEMLHFDDDTFRAAQTEADATYRGGDVDRGREAEFLRRHPQLPTAEIAARDYSSFRVAQRDLVATLLRSRRFALAIAPTPHLLLCHAGVTRDELDDLGVPASTCAEAPVVADRLNSALDAAVAAWSGNTPLTIPVLHQPGDARSGEGRGILYHRAADPERKGEQARHFAGPPRRRFDPRRLPLGLSQGIGHVRDNKCRELLGTWAMKEASLDGPLRHLRTDGHGVRYQRGVPGTSAPDQATLLFLDGGMFYGDPHSYQLLDLDTGAPAAALRS